MDRRGGIEVSLLDYVMIVGPVLVVLWAWLR